MTRQQRIQEQFINKPFHGIDVLEELIDENRAYIQERFLLQVYDQAFGQWITAYDLRIVERPPKP